MDTDKLQQITSFIKGMNTDISDTYLDNDQYRFAKNLRLTVNNDSNSGELHLIDGVVKIDTDEEFDDILGTASIRDYGIIITRKGDTWSIYKFNITEDPIKLDEVFGPCTEPLWTKDDDYYKLSLVTRWESDLNIKLYIADGVHSLMIVNIMKNNGIDFANISTKENIMLTQPVVEEVLQNQGDLNYAVVQYAYKLYNQYGISTNISPLSKPELIYTTDDNGFILGIPSGESSSVALKIKITPPDSEFERIKVYRIGYVQKGQTPEIYTILDEKLNDLDPLFTFIDNGTGRDEIISSDEFSVDAGVRIIPKIIESKNDYLFAANVNYVQDELFSDWDVEDNIEWDVFARNEISGPRSRILLDSEQAYGKAEQSIVKPYLKQDYIKYSKECLIPSLRRGEVYRYGIVLYDNHGNRSLVKWFADAIYDEYINDFIKFERKSDDDYSYSIYSQPVGLHVKIKELPENCSGYEIVRCERTIQDSYTVSQGVLSCTIKHNTQGSELYGQYSASPIICTDRFYHGYLNNDVNDEGGAEVKVVAERSTLDLISFVSPEVSYLSDDIQNILDTSKYYINPLMVYAGVTDLPTDYWHLYKNERETPVNVYFKSETVLGNLKYALVNAGDEAGVNKIIGAGAYSTDNDYSSRGLYCSDNVFGGIGYHDNYFRLGANYNTSFLPNDTDTGEPTERWFKYAAYFKLRPYHAIFSTNYTQIEESKIPELYKWNELFSNDDKGDVNIRNKSISLEGMTYDNCSVGTIMNQLGSNAGSIRPIDKMNTPNFEDYEIGDTHYRVDDYRGAFAQLIGPGGKLMIIKSNIYSDISVKTMFDEQYANRDMVPPLRCILCNICKKTNALYGGNSDLQKRSNIYYSHGNFYNSNVTEVDVYDGDTYILLYEHVHLHKWWDANKTHGSKQTVVYAIPLESSINLAVAHGASYSELNLSKISNYDWILNNSAEINALLKIDPDYEDAKDIRMNYTQNKPMYQYNTAYSSVYNALIYAAQQDSNLQQGKFDSRVHYSNPKLNNEIIDSWLTFAPANFLDVDTRFGLITGLRLFKDKLIYWQEHATGVLSVNERSLITDASNSELVLGTGDVLSRYDYMSTTYGMHKNQYCDAQSEHNLYWWDENKRALCNYTQGGSVTPLNVVKQVKKYTNTIQYSNNPVLLFDNDNHELLTCISDDESIVYNEQIQGFTSIYELNPDNYILFRNGIVLVKDRNLYHYNKSINQKSYGFNNEPLTPLVEFVINKHIMLPKVYDNLIINGKFDNIKNLNITYNTYLGQEGKIEKGMGITDRQLDYRLAIPRNENSEYGDRLRGKVMNVTLESTSNNIDFSISNVLTKFRLSL